MVDGGTNLNVRSSNRSTGTAAGETWEVRDCLSLFSALKKKQTKRESALHYWRWWKTTRRTGYYVWPHPLLRTNRSNCSPRSLSLCPHTGTQSQQGSWVMERHNLFSQQNKEGDKNGNKQRERREPPVRTSLLPASVLPSLSSPHHLVSCASSVPRNHLGSEFMRTPYDVVALTPPPPPPPSTRHRPRT